MRYKIPPTELESVRDFNVKSNPDLAAQEQDTTVSFVKDGETIDVYSDVPTFIKWILSVKDVDIRWVHLTDDDSICGCKARAPKGCFKLKPPRKSNNHYGMTTYGDER